MQGIVNLLLPLGIGYIAALLKQEDSEAIRPTYYFIVVLTRDGDAAGLAKKLLRKGIDTGKHIMRDCSAIDGKDSGCPSACEAVRVSLQVPNYPRLTEADMRYIAWVLAREGADEVLK
jgi:dTDP-4-amino-4,6-dideoxygalactose transaminase